MMRFIYHSTWCHITTRLVLWNLYKFFVKVYNTHTISLCEKDDKVTKGTGRVTNQTKKTNSRNDYFFLYYDFYYTTYLKSLYFFYSINISRNETHITSVTSVPHPQIHILNRSVQEKILFFKKKFHKISIYWVVTEPISSAFFRLLDRT